MKLKHYIILLCSALCIYTECRRNYFLPDPDDPGLGRFTSLGGSSASSYMNGEPFFTIASSFPLLYKDSTGNAVDTLAFQWNIYPYNSTSSNISLYQKISFLITVPQSFNKNDLLSFNGQKILNSKVVIQMRQDTSLINVSGTANLFFVLVTEDSSNAYGKNIKLSGLFNGNIGDSIIITKGRFDFAVDERQLNF